MRQHSLLGRFIAFAILALGFGPLVTRAVTAVAIAGVAFIAAPLLGLPADRASQLPALQARSPLSRQPTALQLVEALLIADFISYRTHRAFHARRLWRLHAIHHSSRQLDWLAATRLHPINELVSKLCSSLPLLFLGFTLSIFALEPSICRPAARPCSSGSSIRCPMACWDSSLIRSSK
jgi:sterol desaturase/sphingolipid hydroxylase (fatty acid hydroxylase superfamily)